MKEIIEETKLSDLEQTAKGESNGTSKKDESKKMDAKNAKKRTAAKNESKKTTRNGISRFSQIIKPDDEADHYYRTTIVIRKDVHKRIKVLCAEYGITITVFINKVLEDQLKNF